MMRCPHCGATLSPHDPRCPYCGAPNPHYQPVDNELNHLLEQGMRAFQEEAYARAVDAYQRAIILDPHLFDAYFYLTACLSALGRNDEAIKTMKSASALRPNSSVVYYNLGLLYKRTGQAREARAAWREALRRIDGDVALQDRKAMKKKVQQALNDLGA